MIPKDEMKEMNETLSEVAKMKAHFELLKQAIKKNLGLNYSGNALRIEDDRLILEIMEMIEPETMREILANLKSEDEASKMAEVACDKEDDNG